MRLIVTRPMSDAANLARRLEQLGHVPQSLPLLDIVPRKAVAIPVRHYRAICLTSANGLAADLDLEAHLATPVLCVGPQSAAAASTRGFARVSVHGGDVESLVTFIKGALDPSEGPVLYLSGATTSGDLEGQLQRVGYAVDRVVTYDAVAIPVYDLAATIAANDGVLLYSPRSAALWVAAVEREGAQQRISTFMHYCLSRAVAKRLPQSWPKRIAAAPVEASMLAALAPNAEQE